MTGGIAGVASLAHHSAWRVCASYGGDSRRRGRVGALVGIVLERNPAAIEGDDASPRDPAPTTRDDAPAVVDPTGAGAERAGGAGGLGGPGGALPTPIDDHRHARGPGVVPPDPSRLSLDDTDPTTAPAISETYPVAAPAAASGPHPPSPKPPWRWHPSRRRPDETDADPRWLARRKHFFILSDAGKPISLPVRRRRFPRGIHRDARRRRCRRERHLHLHRRRRRREVFQTLRSISFGARHEMVFLSRGPVYLVALASAGSPRALRASCAFSTRSFSRRSPTRSSAPCAARRVSTRANSSGHGRRVRDPRAHAFTWDPATFLGAWAPAPFPPTARRRAATTGAPAAIATRAAAAAGAHAALLATTHHVITLVTAARRGTVGVGQCAMDPDDALVLLNFARSGESFARNPENFAPVCLPRFRSSAFAHAYVAYLEPEVVLVLVATRSDAFFALREARVALEATLRREGVLERRGETRRRSRAGWGWGRREPRGRRTPGTIRIPRRTRLVKRRHSRRVARGTWAGASVDPGRCASRRACPGPRGRALGSAAAPSLSLHETAAGTIRRPGMGRAAGRSRRAETTPSRVRARLRGDASARGWRVGG